MVTTDDKHNIVGKATKTKTRTVNNNAQKLIGQNNRLQG
jgi:hypothetical protein